MMIFETNSEFGQRVARRLAEERIGWLTTVDSSGTPHLPTKISLISKNTETAWHAST
jgi:hypothetical protein